MNLLSKDPQYLNKLETELFCAKGQSYLAKLASAVENYPKWRFELIITNPRKRLKIDPATRLISFKEIEERIRVTQEMLASKQYASALFTGVDCS